MQPLRCIVAVEVVVLGDSRFESIRIDLEDRIETTDFRFATFHNSKLGLNFNVIFKSDVHFKLSGISYFRFCFVIGLHAYTLPH